MGEVKIVNMLQSGVIEPSSIVLVCKKDGKTRFCVDNRHLNAATVKDSCPIPDIGDSDIGEAASVLKILK